MSLRELLKEPKGKMIYRRDQIFLLHVFWEAPDITAARILLEALGRCAKATHRDTPCVATYHFRICSLSSAVISQEPKTVREHAQLQAALKKLKFGVPRSAVLADLRRRAIDTYLLDSDQETPLPNHMQQTPVMLEFTELYLDERAFYEHAGSKDYLDAYGEVMQPKLMNRQATVCVGSPTAEIKEKILDPMLKAIPQPIPEGCHLWRAPKTAPETSLFISLEAPGMVDSVMQTLPLGLLENSTTCLAFPHPLLQGRIRIICILTKLLCEDELQAIIDARFEGVEIHCPEEHLEILGQKVAKFSSMVDLRATQSGYAVHESAGLVKQE